MNTNPFIELMQNIAVLLAFSMLYDYFWIKEQYKTLWIKNITGIIIGSIGIILMFTPWTFIPGIVFDTRSVLLSIAGLFFGVIPTFIAIIITGSYRLLLGGGGALMGVSVILFSGLTGILWKRFLPDFQGKWYLLHLLALGYLVHIIMLACTLLLPGGLALITFKKIALPVLTIYPIGTMLLGGLMVKRSISYQTKKALLESQENYRRLHESITDAYAMVDMHGNIIEFNPAFQKMLGYKKEELLKLNLKDITPEKWHAFEAEIIQEQVLKESSSTVYQKEYIHKSGRIFPIELKTYLLKDEYDKNKAMWAIIRDITERKQFEKELINAKEKAEENDKLKSIFLANMSHEIRTPMNAIMGFSVLLGKEGITDDSRKRYLNIINNSSERLLHIINDILDISKLEANQLPLFKSEFDLVKLCEDCAFTFSKSRFLKDKPKVQLYFKKSKTLENRIIYSDPNRLQQILDNLINNALKNTEEGFVEFGYYLAGDKSQNLEFYVKDTGTGIAEEHRNIIFKRFRQIDEESYHLGAGLGLSISKGIVELMGGTIWFESMLNKGTTFYFTIPYLPVTSSNTLQEDEVEEIGFIKEKKIYIADDDFESFLLLKEILPETAIVRHASNGRELVTMIEKEVPDLILLDINMPVMNGFQVLAKLKEEGLNLRIIAQTAYAMLEEKEKCLKEGCQGYISKPIHKQELFRALKAVFNQI